MSQFNTETEAKVKEFYSTATTCQQKAKKRKRENAEMDAAELTLARHRKRTNLIL
jgi:hypothetical protein